MFYLYKRRIFLPEIPSRPVVKRLAFMAILATTLLSSCFLKQDRTTTVYGTITDQNGEPVDSIVVIFKGVKNFKYDSLNGAYSNSKGEFAILQEVPKKYYTVNILIPFGSSINPKFQKNFKDYKIYKMIIRQIIAVPPQ
ncbi:carboxypeptidase-like regulatory domain-containing protein [Dyadobacter sp. CY107]|uniref:carboxypeptidase-like regulatory domain-containing protein n=1 Tax=Dyadobacter fanqingshengii TaxID=2906443 RepID=UPI001F31DB2F|nr:carboxypeptidase-like regulatory domain-containing protein [Dyadobacter fanqingshengii]MCF2503956.1 carboxypeptidase-like regulatory domain-containing protein [Dyadobacter fanqingshengii]